MFLTITRHLTRAAAAIVVGALALGAGPAMAQVTTLGDGVTALSPTTPINACPGGAAVRADYFTLQASQAGDYVTRVKVVLGPDGAYTGLSQVSIRNAAGTVTYGSAVPASDLFDVALATTFAVGTTATEYSIWVTPKAFGAIPTSVASSALTAKVDLVFNRFPRTGADTTSGPVRLDSQPPAEVGWTSLAATTSQITLTWNVPADAQGVLVLRDTKPVTDAPVAPAAVTAYGAVGAVFPAGTSNIRFAGTAAPWRVADTGLTAGASYYYKAFVRDACGNWSAGELIGPIVAGGAGTEGDPTGGSLRPMVGVLTPIPAGVVGRNFKVQARIFSPKNGATVQPISSATITVRRPDGTTAATGTLARNSLFGTASDSGVFEPSPVLSLSAGAYTLQVRATNPSGSANSAVVPFTVGAGAGDGNILRRENSSQLCSDCHAIPTHSSETTSNKYGAWFAGCRACHQPHGTPNASLVASSITPPQVAAQLPPTRTYYSTSTGYDPAAGATSSTTVSAATFANGDRTGPCQVCHTRTNFFRRAGFGGDGGPTNLAGGGAHYTSGCGDCHKHSSGFTGGGCTSCHGTQGRTAVGADTLVAAAPPRDHLANTVYTAPGVGAHLAHVTGSRFRAPLACSECHPNPGQSPHPDSTTQVAFQAVDCDWGRGSITCTPQQPYARPSCSALYCHGNFNGGASATVQWTAAPGSVTCGSCHAIPPAAPHTSSTACGGCHGSAYTTSTVDGTLHMNGQLDAASCNGCHGDPARVSNWSGNPNPTIAATFTDTYVSIAPPADASAAHNTATTARGVGAHQTHVNKPVAGALSYPFVCTTCHTSVPADGTHGSSYTTPSIVAATGWNGASCNNTCHSRTGAATPNPSWTQVNGSIQASCGSCHASPPTTASGGHPANSTCTSCHPAGYTVSPTRAVAYATHVDGVVQVNTSTGCARCHGVIMNAAPNTALSIAPGYVGTTTGVDTRGNSVASVVTVGAHDAHLQPARAGNQNFAAAYGCATCHGTLPTTVAHAGGTIDLGWSTLASSTFGASASPAAFNAAFEASPTCLVYCHSNASPVGGARSSTRSPAWNVTGATLACNSCHAFQADQVLSASSTNLSHGHWKHTAATTAGGYALNCSECHNGIASGQAGNPAGGAILGPTSHVNGSHNVVFNPTTNPGTTSYAQGPSYTCANTYCHSNGTSTATPPANTSVAWTGAVTCGSCHNQGAAMATGKHREHVNNLAVNGANYLCGDCHNTTVAAGTDAVMIGTGATPTHVNRAREVSISTRGTTGTSTGGTGGTCSNVYCHSTGQPSTARRNVTANWTDAAWTGNVCNKCHGSLTPNAWGAPDYANGGANTLTANSHAAHATGSDDCFTCHRTTTATGTAILAGTVHLNGATDVVFSTTIAGTNAQAGFTARSGVNSASCRNISCHGNNTTAVVWGGPSQTCRSCHMGAAGSATVSTDVNDYAYGNGTVAKIDPEEWGTFGHGAVSQWVESLNTASNFDQGGQDGCMYCHDTAANGVAHGNPNNPFRLKNVGGALGKLGVCLACHDASQTATTWMTSIGLTAKLAVTKISAVHYGDNHSTGGGGAGGQYCWDCHDPHGDYNYTASQRLAYMFQAQPVMNHTATALATDWGVPRTAADLANTPDFRKNRSGSATAWDWTDYVTSGTTKATALGACQVCHTVATHFSQTISESAHPGGASCITCHAHQQTPTTNAFTGNGDCIQCHSTTKTIAAAGAGAIVGQSRSAVVGEFAGTWSHARSKGGTPSKWDCIVCHMEGDPQSGNTRSPDHMNGTIDLRDPDTGNTIMTATWSNSPAGAGSYSSSTIPATANRFQRNLASNAIETFAASVMINQCLKCHDSNGAQAFATGRPLNVMASRISATPEKPFGTTITYTGQTPASPSGAGVTANGVVGGVINVDASFATTNASYHPVKGKQNNSYTGNAQMAAPWNTLPTNKTAGNITAANAWGFLLTCWDCHAATGATGTLTRTVTAHGGASTARGAIWASGTTGSANLCRTCHFPTSLTSGHGAGSAAGTVDSRPQPYMGSRCNYCHMSALSKPPRPIPAEDMHGFDTFASNMGTDKMWPIGAAESYKPYGFMRNVGPTGEWRTQAWRPRTAPGLTSATTGTCGGTWCRTSHGTYGPGGVY